MKSGSDLNHLEALLYEMQQEIQKEVDNKLLYLVTNYDPGYKRAEFLIEIKKAIDDGANIAQKDVNGKSIYEHITHPELKDYVKNLVANRDVTDYSDLRSREELADADAVKRFMKNEGIFYEEASEPRTAQPAGAKPSKDPLLAEVDKAFNQADEKLHAKKPAAPAKPSTIGQFSSNTVANNYRQFDEVLKPMVNNFVEALKEQRSASDQTLIVFEAVNAALQCIEKPDIKQSFKTFLPMLNEQINVAKETVSTTEEKRLLDQLGKIIDNVKTGIPIGKLMQGFQAQMEAMQKPKNTPDNRQ